MIDLCAIEDVDDFISRVDTLNYDIAQKGVLYYAPHDEELLTGYTYHQVYDWDSYFESIYLSYFGVSDYCFNNTKSFLKYQKENGFVSRTIDQSRTKQHFKPFLAQMAELGSRQEGDYTWVNEKMGDDSKTIFERLELSIEYWFNELDADGNGLPVWNSADHSGMDNQISRAGDMDEFRYEGVDLACYIYREYLAMAEMASKLGMEDKKSVFETKAQRLAKNINDVFWCEQDGIYYDRDEMLDQSVKVKCISTFIPLWAGVASAEQAARLVDEHLINPEEFWLEYPVATYAKSQEDFIAGHIFKICNWRGPAWVPTNYMVTHGLNSYGYSEIASQVSQKTFDMVYTQNDVTREFYNSQTGEGMGLPRFWGWSSLAYFMPLESILDYDPSKIGSDVTPIAIDHFGFTFPEAKDPLTRIEGTEIFDPVAIYDEE